jgi:PAS domain S-box-containing protein
LVLNLLVALVYFFMARASLAVAFEYSNATPVWPCSGFALAVVLLWGYDVVPAIALGAFAANVATFLLNKTAGPGTAIWVSALIGIGNTGEAIAGYFLLNKLSNIHNILIKARSIFKFSFVALIMCIVSSTIGTTAVLLGGVISLSHYMEVWLTWWAGDVSGVLIVTPLILVFASSKSLYTEPRDAKSSIEVLVFFLLLILLSGILFEDWFNPMFIFTRAFLLVPLLIWASLRFDQREVIFAVIVSSAFAVFGTMDHHGAFVTDSLNESLVTAEVYCSINAVLALVLNALIMERKRSETILKQARDELELRVQKRTEELTKSNQQLSEAQRLAHIGSWEWDIAHNKITWSDELYSIYGLSKNQFDPVYENFLQRLHPDDRAYANDTIQRAYKNHQPFYFYHRIIRPDGEVRLLLGQGEVITNDKGEPIKMTGTGLDVTEIKKAEDLLKKTTIELEQKNEELERSNKELASFSYIASHDLQEPLRKMQTFSERILQNESEKLSDSGKDYFRRIQSAAGRMQQLIEDLLSYSRVNTAEKLFVETDLNMLLQEVKNDLSDFIQTSNATIEAGTLPTFKVIPFQFRQLLTNIISNSIKFSKPGCAPYISIRAGFEKGSEIEEPEADRKRNYYHLSIIDNGIGFEQKFSKKIFDIFQRLHGRHEYPGTGIGLAICKKIVENHYGFITAKSQMDEGATFNIYLPVLPEEEMKKILHSNLQ